MSLAPAKNGGEGVVVTSVDPNGTAGDRFKNGDVILDVNGKLVSSPAEVRKAVSDAQAGGKAHRIDAGEVGTGDALRRRSHRQRVTVTGSAATSSPPWRRLPSGTGFGPSPE